MNLHFININLQASVPAWTFTQYYLKERLIKMHAILQQTSSATSNLANFFFFPVDAAFEKTFYESFGHLFWLYSDLFES